MRHHERNDAADRVPPMHVTPGTRSEVGFTLVELIVGMVLSMIVLALILGLVTDLFGSSERSGTKARAQKAAVDAVEQLTTDLRATRAPEREPRFVGSPDNLRAMMLGGDNPTGVLIHDITAADAASLTFYAEVDPNSANSECVTWAGTATGALHRTVRAFTRGCGGGATLMQTEVMPTPETARASAAASIPSPFSYKQMIQPSPAAADPDPDACTTPAPSTTLTTPLQRDQVVAVVLDLRSFLAGRVGRGDQQLQSAVSIPGRQGLEYHYAIGCAA